MSIYPLMRLHKFEYTIISFFISIIIFTSSLIWNLDITENCITFLQSMEMYEIDELMMSIVILIIGLVIDRIRCVKSRSKIMQIQQEQVATMQATMTTVQDIVNNAFNGLQYIKVKAEIGEELTPIDFETYDKIIFDTTDKINHIRNLTHIETTKVTSNHIGISINDKKNEDKEAEFSLLER